MNEPTFNDLVFEEHLMVREMKENNDFEGEGARITFPNGYGASVVRFQWRLAFPRVRMEPSVASMNWRCRTGGFATPRPSQTTSSGI